ncbi:ribonuclease P protein component 1 [Halorarum salinum]|uniref:Ribonuclease P protein component 1 n=1 Tax=Halorarum salinum TaxID=2743089 RepID=A0A7D5LCK1_9EURY|nr:ribonuclease P protein subunit [Halobaculum salinum]QLG63351.1 ribonuclease P protein subunit [Halobaculum salinum]
MPLTPETLTRHELIGLPVRVAAAASDAHVGIAGHVVSESQRTLSIRETPQASRRGGDAAGASGDKVVPKRGATFEFALPSARDSVRPEAREAGTSEPTDEAAGARKPPGSACELPSLNVDTLAVGDEQYDTAGVTAGQSGGCEDAVYVTVDGARLLSRPAFRTERAGDSTWQ